MATTMLSKEIAPASAPRPKVHRLPGPVATKNPALSLVVPRPKKDSRPSLMAAAIIVALLAAGAFITRQAVVVHNSKSGAASAEATQTPPVEVTESASIPSPIGEAQAATAEKPGQTIVLQGNKDSIVGTLARIPAENEQITEIKAISDIDNNAGRELLSIISKY